MTERTLDAIVDRYRAVLRDALDTAQQYHHTAKPDQARRVLASAQWLFPALEAAGTSGSLDALRERYLGLRRRIDPPSLG